MGKKIYTIWLKNTILITDNLYGNMNNQEKKDWKWSDPLLIHSHGGNCSVLVCEVRPVLRIKMHIKTAHQKQTSNVCRDIWYKTKRPNTTQKIAKPNKGRCFWALCLLKQVQFSEFKASQILSLADCFLHCFLIKSNRTSNIWFHTKAGYRPRVRRFLN